MKPGGSISTGLREFNAHPGGMAKGSRVLWQEEPTGSFISMQQNYRFQRHIFLLVRIEERILKGLDFLCEQVALGTSKIVYC